MIVNKLFIVTAMEQEAEALCPDGDKDKLGGLKTISGTLKNGSRYKCIISGIGTKRAAKAAQILCTEKPDLILSIGVSGGLAPGLTAGTLISATTINSEITAYDSWHETDNDATTRSELFPSCGNIQCGQLVTAEAPVLNPQDKMLMHDRTGALAVDMESIAVAQVAAAAGIPFGCIRAISDDAKREIPAESMDGVDENGTTNIKPILKAIMKRPSLIFELIPMGMDYSKALKSLGTILK